MQLLDKNRESATELGSLIKNIARPFASVFQRVTSPQLNIRVIF